MAVQNFILDLMESLLQDKTLGLTEEDLRFYDKNTTVQEDDALNDHIMWKNARYYNDDSNVVRSSLLLVQIRQGDRAHHASFHVGDLYRIYRKNGMKALLPTVVKSLQEAKEGLESSEALAAGFTNYEAIKDQLILRPLNLDNNDKVLRRGIYRPVGDIALVLYISVSHTSAGTILTSMVERSLFEQWDVEEAETLDWALQNTMRLQPPVLFPLTLSGSTVKAQHLRFLEDESVKLNFDQLMAPILTTEQEVNGAVAAFYPGVLQRLYRMIGDDYYLSFTGISEVHIHPVHGQVSLSAIRKSLADMNRINRREELLSRKLYLYKGETGEFCGVK